LRHSERAYSGRAMSALEIRIAALSIACYGSSGVAFAGPSSSPITIDECRITNNRSYVSAHAPLVLVFTNREAVPAGEIRFTVRYAGRTEHIVDKGTFYQNVRIEHAFNAFYNARYAGPGPSCSVDYVEFRDGSTWSAASSAPECAGAPAPLEDAATIRLDSPNGSSVREVPAGSVRGMLDARCCSK
jgi:hypothetical protein